MACPHFRLSTISRGSTRGGKVRRPQKRGGSAAKRVQYIERGGTCASRSDEVLAKGYSGPDLGDWVGVDRAELRRDAIVGRELTTTIPHQLSLVVQMRVAQELADYLRRVFGCAVKWALHRASDEPGSDKRNVHVHFVLTSRVVSDTGEFGAKTKILDKSTTANKAVAALRGYWQDRVNDALISDGSEDRLDLRTRAAQGLEGEAQKRVPKEEYQRARRGEIHSPQYARNQSIITLRAATATIANATTNLFRVWRSVAFGVVIRGRARRAARQRGARRGVGSPLRPARTSGRGFQGDRRDESHDPDHHRVGHEQSNRANVARPSLDHQRAAGCVSTMDSRRTSGSDRCADRAPTRNAAVATGDGSASKADVTRQEQPPAMMPSCSLLTRAIRWIGGSERKEAAATARTPTTQKQPERRVQGQYEVHEQFKGTKRTGSGGAEDLPGPARCVGTGVIAHSERVRAAAESVLPIIRVETIAGGRYYIRREDWLTARAQNLTNVPTCDWRGDPVQSGGPEKATLRRTTIENSTLVPLGVVVVDTYLEEREGDHKMIL